MKFNDRLNILFDIIIGQKSIKCGASYLDTTPENIIKQIDNICDRKAFTKSGIAIWKDKNSVYKRFNNNALSFFPKIPPSLEGFTDYQITSKQNADLYCSHDNLALKSITPINFKGPIVHRRLGTFHAKGTSFPLLDHNGEPQGIILTSHLELSIKDLPFAQAIRFIQTGLVHLFIRKKKYYFDVNGFDVFLSAKECESLLYLIAGKSAKDIAQYTNLSPRTIESYLENSRMKLNCSHKSEMVDRLVELDFISQF